MAVLHVICYLGPTIKRDWHLFFSPGKLWIAGLILGVFLFIDMAVLAFTSRNKSVRSLVPKTWKKWHRTVYILLPLTLVHAIFVGADFGVNRGPDVKAEADAGALITMLILTGIWLVFFLLRKDRTVSPHVYFKSYLKNDPDLGAHASRVLASDSAKIIINALTTEGQHARRVRPQVRSYLRLPLPAGALASLPLFLRKRSKKLSSA